MRLATLVLLAAGCSHGGSNVTHVDIKTTEDLQRLAIDYGHFTGHVDVRIAPSAAIGLTNWSLVGDAGIDLTIHGSGVALPMFKQIVARTIEIDNVALSDASHGELRASRDVTLSRVAIIDGRRISAMQNPERGLLEIGARGNVTIEDSWFVRNFQDAQPDQLLRITGAPAHVRIARSAFLANAFETEVWTENGTHAALDDAVIYRGGAPHNQRLDALVTRLTTTPVRVPPPAAWDELRAIPR